MPCPADFYNGSREDNRFWQNWLQNVSYFVPRYFQPSNRPDLVWILQQAEAEGKKVKAVGRGWSLNDCAASEDWVVDIGRLNNTITFLTDPATGPALLTPAWRDRQFGASTEKLYHVEAGIRILALNERLEGEGLAMLTLGGSQGQTLAGAISTSTHGSNLDQPPLPGVIQAIHLVTTGGQEVWIESTSEPVTANDDALRSQLGCPDLQIIRDDALLRAAKVTVGRFGIIYAYIIKVTTSYRLAEWTKELSWSSVSDALIAGVGQGNDVPVRGHLGDLAGLLSDPPAGLEISAGVGDFHFLEIILNSNMKARHGDEVCWVRRRWLTDNADDLNLSARENLLCHKGVANIILATTAAALGVYASHIVAIPFYGVIKAWEIATRATALNGLAHNPHITGGQALAESLNAVWDSQIGEELEWLVAELNHILLEHGELNDSRHDGIRGPSWQVLAGLDEGTTGECYRANSTELIFSTETSAHVDFINRLLDEADDFHMGGYITIRFSSRSDAYLSMHNVHTPLAVSIEVTSLYGLEDSEGWIAFAERVGKEMGGRPHWGQQNQMSAIDLLNLYDFEDLQTWWHQCYRMVGLSTTFSNSYTRRRGLEPQRRPDTAAILISPPVLDLGQVARDTLVTRDRGLTVSSVGTDPVVIQGVHLQGTQVIAFSVVPHPPGAFPVTLQPGEAFPISIRFQSKSAREHRARVEITGMDPRSGSPMIVVSVLLVNVVAPDMEVLPTTIIFGLVQVGQQVLRNVLVTNNGSAPLRFRVDPPTSKTFFQWTGDAPNHWRSLPSGGTEVIPVRYKSKTVGRHSSKVVIVSDDEKASVSLFGESVPAPLPEIHAMPRQLSFGLVNVGKTATLQLTLANNGAAPLIINAAHIEGPDRVLFTLPGHIPNMIQAGQTASLSVSFIPAAMVVGGYHATLVIESNADNDPQLGVSLVGTGAATSLLVVPTQIAFNPSPLAPALPPGQGSRRGFNIYNVGAVSLTIAGSSFRVLEVGGGQASPHFEILDAAGQPFPQNDLQLNSGAFQSLSVQFRPVVAGNHSARIEITPTDQAQPPVTVSISGRGI